jgi:branched-chain amino acid transport system substrate-binding protein
VAVGLSGSTANANEHASNQFRSNDTPISIKIGVVLPFSGPYAGFGDEGRLGINLAVNEARSQFGNKIDVQVLYEDSKGEGSATVRAFRKLVDSDNVNAVIGEVLSSNTLAIVPVANELKVPLVVPASTNADITRGGKYVIRVCFLDPEQGVALAKFAWNDLKIRRVAIMLDKGSDYSVGLSNAFRNAFTKLGGKIVGESVVGQDDPNLRPQLVKIKNMHPDAVFLPLEYPRAAQIMRQAKNSGTKLTFLGGDAWSSPKLFEMGGDAVNGSYITAHFTPDSPKETVKAFVTNFEKATGVKPSNMAALSYDAAKMIIQAAMNTHNPSRESLRNALFALKNFPGATGNITIKANGNANKDIVILKVFNKKFNYVKTIPPAE